MKLPIILKDYNSDNQSEASNNTGTIGSTNLVHQQRFINSVLTNDMQNLGQNPNTDRGENATTQYQNTEASTNTSNKRIIRYTGVNPFEQEICYKRMSMSVFMDEKKAIIKEDKIIEIDKIKKLAEAKSDKKGLSQVKSISDLPEQKLG